MPVLDVAGVIRSQLGEPTVTALARRFSADGTCLACADRLDAGPLAVRAYRGGDEIITLIAYHARCTASAWLDIGPAALSYEETWAAVITSVAFPAISSHTGHPGHGGPQEQVLPFMLVRPGLEVVRVRHVGPGEAVDADREDYCRQGFINPGLFSGARRLPDIGQTWVLRNGSHLLVYVVAGDQAWSAPADRPAHAGLIATCQGTVVGVVFEQEPATVGADVGVLADAIANGDVLLGWAPLAS